MDGKIKTIRTVSVAILLQGPSGSDSVGYTVLDLVGSGNGRLLFIQRQTEETHFSTVANQLQQNNNNNKNNICFNTILQIEAASFQKTLQYGREETATKLDEK